MCLQFLPKPLIQKDHKIHSSLTWRQIRNVKYVLEFLKYKFLEYMFTAAFEKQPCRNVSKINSSSEAAFKMHFSVSLFCTCGEFFEEYLWWDATYSKFACTALQLWTTGAEKLYFITVLINAEQQLLQSTSRKLILCLEAVMPRCSAK